MHLDRTDNASKNDCENANTLAHDDDHLVVLAHLRWRWSLSGREGLGQRDSGVFEELQRLFSFTPMSRFGGDVMWCFHELKHVL
jgi:hypothetical protein